jgi:hypothetical protein
MVYFPDPVEDTRMPLNKYTIFHVMVYFPDPVEDTRIPLNK